MHTKKHDLFLLGNKKEVARLMVWGANGPIEAIKSQQSSSYGLRQLDLNLCYIVHIVESLRLLVKQIGSTLDLNGRYRGRSIDHKPGTGWAALATVDPGSEG